MSLLPGIGLLSWLIGLLLGSWFLGVVFVRAVQALLFGASDGVQNAAGTVGFIGTFTGTTAFGLVRRFSQVADRLFMGSETMKERAEKYLDDKEAEIRKKLP